MELKADVLKSWNFKAKKIVLEIDFISKNVTCVAFEAASKN